jgi:FkbM family methyltransferase
LRQLVAPGDRILAESLLDSSKTVLKGLTRKFLSLSGYKIEKIRGVPGVNTRDLFADQAAFLQGASPLTIFDIGAHEGQTYYTYRSLFPDAKIYSFEPSPSLFVALKLAQGKDRNAEAHQLAVSDTQGTQVFHLNQSSGTNSLLQAGEKVAEYYGPGLFEQKSELAVETTTIDQFMSKHSIEDLSILKLDIQGAELMALKGASEHLQRKAIALIFLEVEFVYLYKDQALFHQVCGFLEEMGYVLYNLYNLHSGAKGQLVAGDALFVRQDLLDTRPLS